MDKEINVKHQKIVLITTIITYALFSLFIISLLVLWGYARLVNGLFLFFIFHIFFIYIISVMLVLGIHFYYKNRVSVAQKGKNKTLRIVLLSLLALSVISISAIELKHYDIKTYSRQKWLSGKYDRGRLINSFVAQVDLVGKTKDDALYYLGAPDKDIKATLVDEPLAYYYVYDLGTYLDWIDASTYDVYFNASDIIINARVASH